MKDYKVNKGFMAFQFDGKPVYSIGIESNALRNAGAYHCIVGKSGVEVDVSMDDIVRLLAKYGESKLIRKIKGKDVFIVPLKEVQHEEKIPDLGL